jgi:hypothetical protein
MLPSRAFYAVTERSKDLNTGSAVNIEHYRIKTGTAICNREKQLNQSAVSAVNRPKPPF